MPKIRLIFEVARRCRKWPAARWSWVESVGLGRYLVHPTNWTKSRVTKFGEKFFEAPQSTCSKKNQARKRLWNGNVLKLFFYFLRNVELRMLKVMVTLMRKKITFVSKEFWKNIFSFKKQVSFSMWQQHAALSIVKQQWKIFSQVHFRKLRLEPPS